MAVGEVSDYTQTLFRKELIDDYEITEGKLQRMVSSQGLKSGSEEVKFDIVDPAGLAQAKGRDGNIKFDKLGLNRVTARIEQDFKAYEIDDFIDFKNHHDVRGKQIQKSISACNNSKDKLIYQTLISAPKQYNGGTPFKMDSLNRVLDIAEEMWDQNIPDDGNVYGLLTSRQFAELLKVQEFTNNDYVDVKPIKEGAGPMRMLRYAGINWCPWNAITGKRTANAKGVVFHQSAIGHHEDGDPETFVGYDGKKDSHYSWARVRHSCTILLERGIMVLPLKDDERLV